MADFSIHYDVGGVAHVEHVLLGIRDRALNAAPVLSVILEDMKRLEAELFDTEGRGEWPALAQTTLEQKARKGYPAKILQATGDLMGSLTGDGPGSVSHVTETEAILGTTIEYATYHEHGTSRMPARPPIDVREQDVRSWSKQIQQYIMGVDRMEVEAAGGGSSPFGMGLLDPFGLA